MLVKEAQNAVAIATEATKQPSLAALKATNSKSETATVG